MNRDRDDALRMADALERQRAAESRQANALLERCAADALAAGVPSELLTARSYSGTTRYRTQVQGWYLKQDRSVGLGTDGRFYVLSCPGGLMARMRGVQLAPSDAPLELGRGGRDGESIPLTEAIARLLAPPTSGS